MRVELLYGQIGWQRAAKRRRHTTVVKQKKAPDAKGGGQLNREGTDNDPVCQRSPISRSD
jgi:hypothetical protein